MHTKGSATPERIHLADLVSDSLTELRLLLGPQIQLAMGELPGGAVDFVEAHQPQVIDLLRHLALDARDSMPNGGSVTIRTGRLCGAGECAAMVVHEVADRPVKLNRPKERPDSMRKGRSLGLKASFDVIERAGGHFHVSCRAGETVLTICFPLGETDAG